MRGAAIAPPARHGDPVCKYRSRRVHAAARAVDVRRPGAVFFFFEQRARAMTSEPTRRDTLEEIQREHEELRKQLGNVRQTLAKRLATVVNVAELIGKLCEEVETHFTQEEIDGFFDQVVEQAPRLSSNTEQLRAEHVRLRELIRDLSRCAGAGDGSDDWWERIEAQFHEFSKQLMRHESKENELLQSAYTDDIGQAD